MKKLIALAVVIATLGGCAVYPAPYYGPRVVVGGPYYAPHPYYYHW